MYISRIKLENIRAFDGFDLDLMNSEATACWATLLLGDNATGKTTLLRSLATGLCDESGAASLVRELKGGMIGFRDKPGKIAIELGDHRKSQTWTIITTLERLENTGERVRQKIYPLQIEEALDCNTAENDKSHIDINEFPWDRLFISGYGAGRSAFGYEEYEEYRNVDSIYTLFRYDQPLQSPELIWRRLLAKAYKKGLRYGSADEYRENENSRIKKILHDVLLLSEGEDVDLGDNGIELYQHGKTINLADVADGYKSTITWVLDLVAWEFLFKLPLSRKRSKDRGYLGIVFLDEIEQHLHPRWQRYLVTRLRNQFPYFQFIMTTHSPLCAGGDSRFAFRKM
jgi:predicted ATP-binding protein involved in virulence